MPDLERKSSASFISSNDGGTPASVRRSWMKRSNSYCLRVNIRSSPGFSWSIRSPRSAGAAKTNHERTLSVPYVFRNHLIWSEQSDRISKLKIDDVAWRAGVGRRGKRLAHKEAIGAGERRQHGAVLLGERGCDRGTVRRFGERRPHVVGALVI